MFKEIADNKNPNSLASKSRSKRFDFFRSLLETLPRPIKILDIGGTEEFWEMMDFTEIEGIEIYLLNLQLVSVKHERFISIKGDATDLSEFPDGYFDIVFSNSVIEHLFTWENQIKMAKEVIRTGKNYFIQTPNYWFPIEPHFVFPFFQYLPIKWRQSLFMNYDLGHFKKCTDEEKALNKINEIRLLSLGELKQIFPGFNIYRDKFLGLNKSFIMYKFNNDKKAVINHEVKEKLNAVNI